jgi:hypothetical protein
MDERAPEDGQTLLSDAPEFVVLPPTKYKGLDAWYVAASWRGQHWKVWGEAWQTQEHAEKIARSLPPGWIGRTVFHLQLPGGSE